MSQQPEGLGGGAGGTVQRMRAPARRAGAIGGWGEEPVRLLSLPPRFSASELSLPPRFTPPPVTPARVLPAAAARARRLLHPDVPYTFIFNNEDMQGGTVRMFGPAKVGYYPGQGPPSPLVSACGAGATKQARAL